MRWGASCSDSGIYLTDVLMMLEPALVISPGARQAMAQRQYILLVVHTQLSHWEDHCRDGQFV